MALTEERAREVTHAWLLSPEGQAAITRALDQAEAATAALREARRPTRDQWLDWQLVPVGPYPFRRETVGRTDMAYPMTWPRVVQRNDLDGDYDNTPRGAIKGDLRRLQRDQRDRWHLAAYARRADITPEQARVVLDAFFAGDITATVITTLEAERAATRRDDTPGAGRGT